jgi:rRNA processing protein Krr1/Pno1
MTSATTGPDSSLNTHIIAVVVGIAVTLLVVFVLNNNKGKETTTATATTTATTSKKKKNKKKNNGGSSAANGSAAKATATATKKGNQPLQQQKQQKQQQPNDDDDFVVVQDKTSPAAETTRTTSGKSNSKKKKNKKNNNGNNNNTNQQQQQQQAQPPKKEEKKETSETATATASASSSYNNDYDDYDPRQIRQEEEVWATIPKSTGGGKNKNKNKKPVVATTATATATATTTAQGGKQPVVQQQSQTISIDATKVGIVIGPKGATMQAIQAATGCKLDVNAPAKDEKPKPGTGTGTGGQKPKASVVITLSDPSGDIKKAKQAVQELCSRGYATLLQLESFGESSIQVHPKYLAEIVGPGGKNIQAIQTKLGVKITIPKTDWKPNTPQFGNQLPSCKVGIAGDNKQNVKQAKSVIQSLIRYHHHDITHPNETHKEIYVPTEFFHMVIGRGGSEIKHIKGNYKVNVYMPNEDEEEQENVIVVGMQVNVERAIGYIEKLMARVSEQRSQKYNDEYYG